jgi:phosphoglycerol transferase MdoB-like AlkP superfamily enzyme
MTTRLLKEWIDRQFVRGLMLYLVLPNLAFFLLGREFFIDRARINSDYLFLWIGSCYTSRRMTGVLYICLFVLDLILSTESIYHFSTVELIVMAKEYVEYFPVAFYLMVGALLLLATAVVAVIRTRGIVRPLLSKRNQVLVGTVALAFSGATIVWSSDPYDEYLETFGSSEFAASGLIETGLASYKVAMASHQTQNTMPVQHGATTDMMRDLSLQGNTARPYNIVIILVESQGLLKSASDMRRVFAPLIDPAIQARYAVNTGAVRFFGATMFGELRTLCRIYVPQAVPQDLPRLDRCLPNVLSRLGYETVSYHGYGRTFYERYLWYPKVGFQQSYFSEDLMPHAPDSAKCGTVFKGLCDLWIADQVEHELSTLAISRKFIYWLTLNSHLPVDSDLATKSSFDCARTESLREETGPCELARIHFQLYTRIAQIALDRGISPTRFIVVGDHMPPFATLSERALYNEERVPYVELIPRSASQAVVPAAKHG